MSGLYLFLFTLVFVHFNAGLKVDGYNFFDMLQTDKSVKIPQMIRRMYHQWSSKPKYDSRMIQSLPGEVAKMEDGDLLLTFPKPKAANTTIRKVELLIEVHDEDMSEIYQTHYHVDIRPVSDTLGCFTHATKKPRIYDTYLELHFNITYLYMNCKEADATHIQLKLQFSAQSSKISNVTLKTENMDIFIIIRQVSLEGRRYALNFTTPVTSLFSISEQNMSVQPLQGVIYTRDKRMAVQKQRNMCSCRVMLWYVKFADMGWDWVVAPAGFVANKCVGRCSFPLTDNMNTTTHAVVQTLMNSIFLKPRAAYCAPKELSPLTMIFQEDDILSLKKYPDMIVESCGCL